MEILKRIASFFLDVIETIVVALAIFVIVYLFFFQPHQVKGASMEPNFHDEEYILTDKISYRFHSPLRGDVVVFRAPKNREHEYIKRIVGLPGERIKITNGDVFINGQKIEEDYLEKSTISYSGSFLRSGEEFLISQGEYFVLGDNRPHSSDSREWGTIVREDIIGRAWFRYWPPSRFGIIPKVNYLSLSGQD